MDIDLAIDVPTASLDLSQAKLQNASDSGALLASILDMNPESSVSQVYYFAEAAPPSVDDNPPIGAVYVVSSMSLPAGQSLTSFTAALATNLSLAATDVTVIHLDANATVTFRIMVAANSSSYYLQVLVLYSPPSANAFVVTHKGIEKCLHDPVSVHIIVIVIIVL